MAGFALDDRVKIGALVGTVRWVASNGSAIDVRFDGHDDVTEYVPAELVEKIERAPKVGDLAGPGVLRSLPAGSIVAAADGTIAQRGRRYSAIPPAPYWWLPGDERPVASSTLGRVTILRIGW